MARRGDAPTQSEVTRRIEGHENDLREKGDEMEDTVSDVKTVRTTLESLDLSGTAEGSDAVEQAIEGAEDVSVDEFEQESTELEHIQGETEESETEFRERSETTSQDLGEISKASAEIHSEATDGKLVEAKEAALRDIEFLDEQNRRAREAKDESKRVHAEQRGQVNA